MTCSTLFGGDRRIMGHVCHGRGKGKKRKQCHACGTPHDYLCDGPGCDVPICARHAISVRSIDKDFCRACADFAWVAPCPAASDLPFVKCQGHTPEKSEGGGGICLAHSIAFTAWLRDGGYERCYQQTKMSPEERRPIFGAWAADNRLKLERHLDATFRRTPRLVVAP